MEIMKIFRRLAIGLCLVGIVCCGAFLATAYNQWNVEWLVRDMGHVQWGSSQYKTPTTVNKTQDLLDIVTTFDNSPPEQQEALRSIAIQRFHEYKIETLSPALQAFYIRISTHPKPTVETDEGNPE